MPFMKSPPAADTRSLLKLLSEFRHLPDYDPIKRAAVSGIYHWLQAIHIGLLTGVMGNRIRKIEGVAVDAFDELKYLGMMEGEYDSPKITSFGKEVLKLNHIQKPEIWKHVRSEMKHDADKA